MRQKELYQAVRSHFPSGFLQRYESELNEANEYNWLKVLLRNSKRHVHPLRHLFSLHFLQQDIKNFVISSTDQGAFGAGPFPCLNKAASHYKQFIIQGVDLTRDFKTKKLIGTFTCSCGFIYARKHTTPMFDRQYIKQIKYLLQQLLREEKPVRITTSIIGKCLGILAKFRALFR